MLMITEVKDQGGVKFQPAGEAATELARQLGTPLLTADALMEASFKMDVELVIFGGLSEEAIRSLSAVMVPVTVH